MKAFRIGAAGHPVFAAAGAQLRGGRWNSAGRGVIYAGSSFAIAMLERLVYAGIGRIPKDDRYVEITIADDVGIETVDPAAVLGWDAPSSAAARRFGDRWLDERRSAVLLVPSAVTHLDQNLVLNPAHPDFARIDASAERQVEWDARLFHGAAR